MQTEVNITDLVTELATVLVEREYLLATAESCTGGGIAAACTDLAGSSQWFECGFVTYSNESKSSLLGVSEETLITHGAVSQQTVHAMVVGAVNSSRANVAVATSGIAGPGGGSAKKPVGTVWIAWGGEKNGKTEVESQCFLFDGDRESVRQQAVYQALANLLGWSKKPS